MVGAGIDLIEVDRIRQAAERTPTFLFRVFTPAEIAYARASDRNCWRRFAARFAAKEALLKALGTGLRRVRWCDAEVVRDPLGRPGFRLGGKLAELVAAQGITAIQVSLSHSDHYAVAQVLLLSAGGDAGC